MDSIVINFTDTLSPLNIANARPRYRWKNLKLEKWVILVSYNYGY